MTKSRIQLNMSYDVIPLRVRYIHMEPRSALTAFSGLCGFISWTLRPIMTVVVMLKLVFLGLWIVCSVFF